MKEIYESIFPSLINGYFFGFGLILKAIVTNPLILIIFFALLIRKMKHTFFR